MRDFGAMVRYFMRGTYIADTRVQAELFGPVPGLFEDSLLERALKEAKVLGASPAPSLARQPGPLAGFPGYAARFRHTLRE